MYIHVGSNSKVSRPDGFPKQNASVLRESANQIIPDSTATLQKFIARRFYDRKHFACI